MLISSTELKTLLNNLFISYFNIFISFIKEHPLKDMHNFKVGKIIYLKPSPIATYDDSKKKHSLYPWHEFLKQVLKDLVTR